MSLPASSKRFFAALHDIFLSSSKVASVDILQALIPDIVRGTRSGIDSTDLYGNPITISLDLVGILQDFHEAVDGTDSLNHNGNAGCNLCTFRKNNNPSSSMSRYAYSVLSHSKNPRLQRTVK